MGRAMFLILGMLYYASSVFDGVSYEKELDRVNNKPEAIYTLTLDLTKEDVRVENGFSFGKLYGFETTTDIAEREGALCAVNGMFYQYLGLPMGLIIHNQSPVLSNDIGTPTVVIGEEGEVDIVDLELSVVAIGERETIELYGINGKVPNGEWGAFDSLFGSTTRIMRPSTNYRIVENQIVEVIRTNSPVKLGDADYVLSYAGDDWRFEVGDSVWIESETTFEGFVIEEAFQSGGWLVQDGVSVAKDYEAFVGYTTAAQPRTLVGIKDTGELVFVVVDGRDKNYSLGLSGKEAADLMVEKGCVKAAYLDGGASSTMFIENEIVNQPSGDGEREIAHCILVMVDKEVLE